MVRFRIMNASLNVSFLEKKLEFVPSPRANHVHVIDGFGPVPLRRRLDDALEPLVITRRELAAIFVEAVEMFEHHAPYRRVDLVKPHIVTWKFMVVFSLAAVVAQHPKPFSHL